MGEKAPIDALNSVKTAEYDLIIYIEVYGDATQLLAVNRHKFR